MSVTPCASGNQLRTCVPGKGSEKSSVSLLCSLALMDHTGEASCSLRHGSSTIWPLSGDSWHVHSPGLMSAGKAQMAYGWKAKVGHSLRHLVYLTQKTVQSDAQMTLDLTYHHYLNMDVPKGHVQKKCSKILQLKWRQNWISDLSQNLLMFKFTFSLWALLSAAAIFTSSEGKKPSSIQWMSAMSEVYLPSAWYFFKVSFLWKLSGHPLIAPWSFSELSLGIFLMVRP